MTVVNSNIKALIASQALQVNERALSGAMARLSTGQRINSAADDAAGLAISNRMTAQIKGLNQSIRNANDAISMIQTADGASETISTMLIRMRELAVQAANGTYSSSDKTALSNEYAQLQQEITRLAANVSWNGQKILGANAASTDFQVGADSGANAKITVTFSDIASATAVSAAVLATNSVAATSVIITIDSAISAVDTFRSTLGATANRLQYAADNLANVSTNMSASRSRILDTDYAQATTELARAQIIKEAGTAMLTQANQQPAYVLALLR